MQKLMSQMENWRYGMMKDASEKTASYTSGSVKPQQPVTWVENQTGISRMYTAEGHKNLVKSSVLQSGNRAPSGVANQNQGNFIQKSSQALLVSSLLRNSEVLLGGMTKKAISNGAATAIGAGIGGLIGGGLGYGFGAKNDKLFSTLLGAGAGAGIGGLAGHYGGFGIQPAANTTTPIPPVVSPSSTELGPKPQATPTGVSNIVPSQEVVKNTNPEGRRYSPDPHTEAVVSQQDAANAQADAFNINLKADNEIANINARTNIDALTKNKEIAKVNKKRYKELRFAQDTIDESAARSGGHPHIADFLSGSNFITSKLGHNFVGESVGALWGSYNVPLQAAKRFVFWQPQTIPYEETTEYQNAQGSKVPLYMATTTKPGEFLTGAGWDRLDVLEKQFREAEEDRIASIQDPERAKYFYDRINETARMQAIEQMRKESKEDNPYFVTFDSLVSQPGFDRGSDKYIYDDLINSRLEPGMELSLVGRRKLNNIIANMVKLGIPLNDQNIKGVLDSLYFSANNQLEGVDSWEPASNDKYKDFEPLERNLYLRWNNPSK